MKNRRISLSRPIQIQIECIFESFVLNFCPLLGQLIQTLFTLHLHEQKGVNIDLSFHVDPGTPPCKMEKKIVFVLS